MDLRDEAGPSREGREDQVPGGDLPLLAAHQGRVGIKPGFYKKNPAQWVFFVWVFGVLGFFIFAQKRELLGFFQFQEKSWVHTLLFFCK
jgi:hypothetical protein